MKRRMHGLGQSQKRFTYIHSQLYEILNKCVFSSFKNRSPFVADVTRPGSEFHRAGFPRVTDLSPSFTVFAGGGTRRGARLLDRSCERRSVAAGLWISVDKYSGQVGSCMARNVNQQRLKVIRSGTLSQCSLSFNSGDTCSFHLIPKITRAETLSTDCNRLS